MDPNEGSSLSDLQKLSSSPLNMGEPKTNLGVVGNREEHTASNNIISSTSQRIVEEDKDSTGTETCSSLEKLPKKVSETTAVNKDSGSIDEEMIDVHGDEPFNLVIVFREDWRAKPPKKVLNKPHQTTTVMFTYATNSDSCFTVEKCKKVVRKLQKYHMTGGLPDIPYNFLVGGDGRVYEGRGWHALPRTHADYTQLRGFMIEIAFIGNYRVERPSEAMFDAALDLIHYGKMNKWIKNRFSFIENYE